MHHPILLALEQSAVVLETTPAASITLQQTVSRDAPSASVVIAFALVLALIHIFAGMIRFRGRVPRRVWLSFGNGISVAYIFVHLLPELKEGGEAVEASGLFPAVFASRHVYLVALAGFVLFYGLESLSTYSSDTRGKATPSVNVFWIHIGSFTVYNGLIGYLLHARDGLVATILFTVAMAVHFIVNDYNLRDKHKKSYHDTGRWIISIAIILGAVLGLLYSFTEALIAVPTAFISGGVILNTIKEELLQDRESWFWAFGAGAVFYTAVLLIL